MSSIKAFASKFLSPITTIKHITGRMVGHDKVALDVTPTALYPLGLAVNPTSLYSAVNDIPNADKSYIVITAHGARLGDTVRFTSGLNINSEASIEEIIDANTLRLGTILLNDIQITDDLLIMRAVTLTLDSSGSLVTSQGPVQFVLDGINQQVIEDTVTPANNAPLPVKLTGVTGDVNITAGDLNVQTSHLGASFDSQRIGNGTNLWDINASLEGLVHDTDALAQLVLLVAKDFSTETTSAAILAKLIAAPSTEAKQDTAITALGTLGTQATSAAILAKIIAAPSTEAKQDTAITALGTLGTEVTLAALLAKVIAAPATEAKQDTLIAKDFATQTTLAALLAKVIAAPATEAKQDDIITALGAISLDLAVVDQLDSGVISAASINGSAGAFFEVIASTAAISKRVQIIEDIGHFMALYTGAAASEVFLCNLPLGGGDVEINVPASTRITIRSTIAASPTGGNMSVNLLG